MSKLRLIAGVAAMAMTLPSAVLFSQQPAKGAASVRSILSGTSLTAYDSAAAGSYFPVTSSEFLAAQTSLSSVTKIGMSDAQLTGCNGGWSSNGALVYNNTITIPANAYILGYAAVLSAGVATDSYSRLITSTSYKGSYDFLVTSNYPRSVAGVNYYLFKTPATSASTRYVGTWANASQCSYYIYSGTGGYSIKSSGPFTSWTTYGSDFPAFQILYTTLDQWTPTPATVSNTLTGNVKTVLKGVPITITSSLSDNGLVTFKYNDKNIGGCVSVRSASLSATCNWKPSVQGSGRITATLRSPTAEFASVTSSALYVSVIKRGNNR